MTHRKGSRKASKKTRKSRRKTMRKMRGGQYTGPWTGAYSFGAPVAPGSDAQTVVPTSGCVAAVPDGFIKNYSGPGGLPGVGGGRRRHRRAGKPTKRQQRGGRYTVDVGAGPIGNGPFVAGAAISRIGCEGGLVNTAPPGAALNPMPMNGGAGNLDLSSGAYYAPTAGYGNQSSQWVSSTGTPALLQIPYDARSYNPACLTTA